MHEFYETYQRVLLAVCITALCVLVLGMMLYRIRREVSVILGIVRRHPWAAFLLSPCVSALFVYGSTKPVTPTVRGITLGAPMETPSSVALEWRPDEGKEIKTNQLVRVYWRDAYTPWTLAGEGYGITNAVVNGFFINRDTDWMVEVEEPDEEDSE